MGVFQDDDGSAYVEKEKREREKTEERKKERKGEKRKKKKETERKKKKERKKERKKEPRRSHSEFFLSTQLQLRKSESTDVRRVYRPP